MLTYEKVFLLLVTSTLARNSYVNVTILVMYSGNGIYANVSDTYIIGKFWGNHL